MARVVFLRLLQPITADRGHPVAYMAEFLAATPEGNRSFQLRALSTVGERKLEPL